MAKKYKYFLTIFLLLICAATVIISVGKMAVTRQKPVAEAVMAYSSNDLKMARKIAAMNMNDPLARLIYNYCQIFDKENTNTNAGLAGLKTLYQDESIDKNIRAEAGLSCARTIQVFQEREINAEYKNVNIEEIYRNVIEMVPNDLKSCTAAFYLSRVYFKKTKECNDLELFNYLEQFIRNYQGAQKDVVQLHLCIGMYYIELKDDYKSAFYHIKAAYDTGITADLLKGQVLFKLGRISDIKLNEPAVAKTYYEKYLELYPNNARTPVIKRYLQELEHKGR